MDGKTIKRLEKILNREQLENYITYSGCFMSYVRSKTPESHSHYRQAEQTFLNSTGGKLPCEVIPLTVWQ